MSSAVFVNAALSGGWSNPSLRISFIFCYFPSLSMEYDHEVFPQVRLDFNRSLSVDLPACWIWNVTTGQVLQPQTMQGFVSIDTSSCRSNTANLLALWLMDNSRQSIFWPMAHAWYTNAQSFSPPDTNESRLCTRHRATRQICYFHGHYPFAHYLRR